MLRLRRTPASWFLSGDLALDLCFSVLFVIIGLVVANLGVAVFGATATVLLVFAPALRGVRVEVSERTLVFGRRWKRRRVLLDNLVRVEIGTVRRWGIRGMDATGMALVCVDGARQLIPESRYCNLKRLTEWCDELRRLSPGLEVAALARVAR